MEAIELEKGKSIEKKSKMSKSKMKSSYLTGGQSPSAHEIDVTYLLLAITLIVIGAGLFSLDGFLSL